MNCKEESKANWVGDSTAERINLGSLQRIADATEVMAQNYKDLIRERDDYKRWYNQERESTKRLIMSNAALKGHITRWKNRLG